MKHFLPCIFILGLLCGCVEHTYQPPVRPVAYMYPTLMPATQLSKLTPVQISEAMLQSRLDEMGLWAPLKAAGLADTELSIVCRSLARRGYAELDARRTSGELRWVAFLGSPAGALSITAWYNRAQNPEILRVWK